MRAHHFYLGFLTLVALGGGVFYVLHYRYYPVAIMNASVIFASEFERVAVSALQFYVKSAEAVKRRALTPEEVDALYAEIRRATLDKLIGERLIDVELKRRFGAHAAAMAGEKLVRADAERLRGTIAPLYGMTYEEFRATLLLPEAKRALLDETLKTESNSAESWVISARRAARVRIFLPKLEWRDGVVEIAK